MHPFLIAGGLVVGLVLINSAALLLTSLRQWRGQGRQQRLALGLLRQQVETAAVRKREQELSLSVWEGSRKFLLVRKVDECENVASLYLAPFDRKSLPPFKPGQFLTFGFKIPGQPRPVVRCYSLSECYQPEYYRVTVKKIPAQPDKPQLPAGLASCYVHDQLKDGDILDVHAPRGQFTLDVKRTAPVVFIAGGIGLTPLLCMANALAESGASREAWFFYGVRNGREHVMKDHLRRMAQEREKFFLRVCYSRPNDEDVAGKDYDHGECISLDLLKAQLPSNNYEFYLCGPPGMMAAISDALKTWGVPENKIFSEAFGPASTPKPAAAASPTTGNSAPAGANGANGKSCKVAFSRSGRTVDWDPNTKNLLDLADINGVEITSGCRVGNCGTCETAIKAGSVRYSREPAWKAQDGTCLLCVATPDGDLELDA